MANAASCQRRDDALLFSGALDRAAAEALWAAASRALAGVQRIDLSDVTTVDSAGLAMLAELAARARRAGAVPVLVGQPPGLAELRAAYRLDEALA